LHLLPYQNALVASSGTIRQKNFACVKTFYQVIYLFYYLVNVSTILTDAHLQIGMIDDHDECEWVNVSSGTGSPGLSRTNSTEP